MAGQVGKLAYVDRKLGAPSNGQQTTRVLYDTFSNVTATPQSQIEFFTNFQGKGLGQTNLQVSKLDSAESMVIKSLWFGGLFEAVDPSIPFPFNAGGVVCDIVVGNQTVVKALPLHFNTYVGESFDRIHGSNNGYASADASPGQWCEVRLLTNIVIPPQVDFKVVVRGANLGNGDTGATICALSGYGQIFSAGTTF
ncbi:hypothetical protein DRH27_04385 [Candidatus Falkowbacteria bacterium]|nr:MAG: hypothetical protein DRH27_04385 [Candidatus Falkowbacteria bacterium]